MTTAKDECRQNEFGPAAEQTVNYHEGKSAGRRGEPAEFNPWVRTSRPDEWLQWFKGWLAGKYRTN